MKPIVRYVLATVALAELLLFNINLATGGSDAIFLIFSVPALVINLFLPTTVRTNRIWNIVLFVPVLIFAYVSAMHGINALIDRILVWIGYLCLGVGGAVILIIYPGAAVLPWLKLRKDEYVSEIIYSLMPECLGEFWRKALSLLLIAPASVGPVVWVLLVFDPETLGIYAIILGAAAFAFIGYRCSRRINAFRAIGSRGPRGATVPHVVLCYTLCLCVILLTASAFRGGIYSFEIGKFLYPDKISISSLTFWYR